MHLTYIAKSVVLTVAFATQRLAYAKSQNGYAYFDEKFCVLEWIIYLKRLSLIALMLCGVVLYYVPKSRTYARRACCILIDTVANGLKFALNANGTEYEKIKLRDENEEQNKELKIQELYRKIYKNDTRDYGRKFSNEMNFDNGNHKSIRKFKSKKYRTKYNIDGKRHRRNRHRNTLNDVLPESDVMMISTINSPQQVTIDEKGQKDNIVIPQNTSSEMRRITTYTMYTADKLKNNTDLLQENSLNKKTDSTTVSEIIDKNDTKYKLIKFKTASQKQENVNIEVDKKLQNKQNFSYVKPEEIAIVSQSESSKDCSMRIMNKEINSRYEKLFTENDKLRNEKCRFLHSMESFTHECCKNSSITKDRVKPVLLRVVNWLFGGCPEASKRHRVQVNEVGKEEIFKPIDMWLPETSELYLQQ